MDLNCRLCDNEYKSIMSLVIHLRNIHKIKPIEYYDKYIKKENDGKCLICYKQTSFRSISDGYNEYCSIKCSHKSDKLKNKRKQTFIQKYGVENIGQNKEIKEKIKKTNLEKYGGTGFQVKVLCDKSRITHYEKYGFEYPIQNKEIKDKIKQTNIEKYGVENPSKSEKIKDKIKQTNIEKYGVENVFKNEEIKDKIKNKKISNILPKVYNILEYNNLELLSEYNKHDEIIEVKCLKCNTVFKSKYFYIQQGYGKCPNCFPQYKSSGEIELLEFIKSIESSKMNEYNIIENSRDIIPPYELDIYIPEKNIAIEFDGLYWHTEASGGKDKNYHLNKTNLCESKNIRLIHIFEDEWIFKNEIVKSRLRQILGLNNSEKIYARKCQIKEISPKIKNQFLNNYHIQGEDKSSIKLGSFYNNELISVMTFSKGNISKGSKNIEGIYELSRFCSNNNYHVIGIASKLLNYFKKNYEWKEIYSYADRRWSQGNVYKKIGFELEYITKPNYFYIINMKRIHRFNFRKRPDEPKNVTEWVLRQQEGLDRIWDSGNIKFIMKNKENVNV